MRTYIWEDLDDLTDRWHDGGGLVIVTDRNPLEVWRERRGSAGGERDELPEPTATYACEAEAELCIVFPDAGCC